jgi:hypothetical protein
MLQGSLELLDGAALDPQMLPETRSETGPQAHPDKEHQVEEVSVCSMNIGHLNSGQIEAA